MASSIPIIMRLLLEQDPSLRAKLAEFESVLRELEDAGRDLGSATSASFRRLETEAQQTATGGLSKTRQALREVAAAAEQVGDAGAAGLKKVGDAADKAAKRLEHLKHMGTAVAAFAGDGGDQARKTVEKPTIHRSQLAALANNDLLTAQLAGMGGGTKGAVKLAAPQEVAKVKVSMGDLDRVTRVLNTTLERTQDEYRKTRQEAVEFGTGAGVAMMAAGAGALALAGYGVKVAGEFEQLKARLQSVGQSAAQAAQDFEYAKGLAARTPFDVQGMVAATVTLRGWGQDAQKTLPMVANMAAAMGVRVEKAALDVGRALDGELEGWESLRNEYSISNRLLAQHGAILTKTGSISVATAGDLEKARMALERIVQTRFGDAVERQSQTLQGSISNAGDSVTNAVDAWMSGLIPAATLGAKGVSLLADALAAVPAPLRAVTAGTGVAFAGATALGGAALVAAMQLVGLHSQLKIAAETLPQLKRVVDATGVALEWMGGAAAKAKAGAIWMATNPFGVTFLAVATATTVATLALSAYEEEQKRLGDVIEDESARLQESIQNWRTVKKVIEEATGAKIEFNDTPAKTAAAIDAALGGADPSKLVSVARANGITPDQAAAEAAKAATLKADLWKQIQQAQKDLKDAEYEAAGTLSFSTARKHVEELKQKLKDLGFQLGEVSKEKAGWDRLVQDFKNFEGPLAAAAREAAKLDSYLKWAGKAGDVQTLTQSLEVLKSSLQDLEAAGRAQKLPMDDPEALRRRLPTLDKESGEFQLIEQYLEKLDAFGDTTAKINQINEKAHDERIRLMDLEFAKQTAGRDASLAEELAYLQNKLAAVAGHADEEIAVRNRIHAVEKQQHEKNLGDYKAGLQKRVQDELAAVDQLASGGEATAAEVARGYRGVVVILDAWAAAHDPLLKKVPELRKYYEDLRRTVEGKTASAEGKIAGDNLARLKKQGQEILAAASTPTEQLAATQKTLDLYQRVLRTDQEIRRNAKAKADLQHEINLLTDKEAQLKDQLVQRERQLAQELQNMRLQQMDARIGMLEGIQQGPSRRTSEQSESLLRQALEARNVAELQALDERAAAGSRVEEELAERRRERFAQALRLIEMELAAEVAAAKDSEAEKSAAHERARMKKENLALEERQKVLQRLQEEVRATEDAEKRKADARRSGDRLGGSRSPLQSFEEAYSRGFKNPDFRFDDFSLDSEGFSFAGAGVNERIQKPKPKQLGAEDQYLESLKKFSAQTDAGAKAMTELTPALTQAAPATKDLGTAAVDSASSLGTLASAAASAAAALSSIAGAGAGSGTGGKAGSSVGTSVAAGITAGVPDAPSGGGGGAPSADTGGTPQPPPSKYDFVQQRFGFPAPPPTPRMPTPREMGAIPMPPVNASALAASVSQSRTEINQIFNIDGRRAGRDPDLDTVNRALARKLERDQMYKGPWG